MVARFCLWFASCFRLFLDSLIVLCVVLFCRFSLLLLDFGCFVGCVLVVSFVVSFNGCWVVVGGC